MGTHPIFESDFDCLTVCVRLSLGSTRPVSSTQLLTVIVSDTRRLMACSETSVWDVTTTQQRTTRLRTCVADPSSTPMSTLMALKTLTGLIEKHSEFSLPSMQRKLDSSDSDFSLADFLTTVSFLPAERIFSSRFFSPRDISESVKESTISPWNEAWKTEPREKKSL